jgi:hypothetical protein
MSFFADNERQYRSNEALMTSKSSTSRAPKRARQSAKVVEPELDELLAHLGRLIAREYVTLLEETRQANPHWTEEAR